ncbi:hypothetical protein [Hydrogenophaga palleronii]|uniref:hypothetical protein n=1 Tax=Hydrogenophaga palleronii TaxID=65655 RepID=UPI000A8D9018|nr:hypothetical protein [Hydrogenophaga palleronii]
MSSTASPPDPFAIAAHLHVLLRRKTGRVTDTEWMATNPDYAREIVRHALEKAASDNLPELRPWAEKLERAISHMAKQPPPKPLLQAAADALHAGRVTPDAARGMPTPRAGGFAHSMPGHTSGFIESTLNSVLGTTRKDGDDSPEGRYVGGLR